MKAWHLLIAVVVSLAVGVSVYASETGTIDDSLKYGWGENIGWINFAPTHNDEYSGLTVTDTAITGYAWSSSVGWINFSPTESGQGVTNTPEGDVGGSAWTSNAGWISMDGVSIDQNGSFSGVAGTEGSTAGRLSFDCDYCHVRTNWRAQPGSDTETDTPDTGRKSNTRANADETFSGTTIPSEPDATANTSDAIKATEPGDSTRARGQTIGTGDVEAGKAGSFLFDTPVGGSVRIDIPNGAFADKVTISVSIETPTPVTAPAPGVPVLLIGGVLYNVIATDSQGTVVHTFDQPITIAFEFADTVVSTDDLAAYYLDEVQGVWVRVPDAVFMNTGVTIQVDHLTRFAVFSSADKPDIIPTINATTTDAQASANFGSVWFIYVLILCGMLIGFGLIKKQEQ